MKERPDRLYILDILSSINRIREYIKNDVYETFSLAKMTQDAVFRNLEIIGEASRNITEETRLKAENIPWNRMKGLRNIVSHKHFGVDLEIVWEVITKNLPLIEPEIRSLLDKIQGIRGSKEE